MINRRYHELYSRRNEINGALVKSQISRHCVPRRRFSTGKQPAAYLGIFRIFVVTGISIRLSFAFLRREGNTPYTRHGALCFVLSVSRLPRCVYTYSWCHYRPVKHAIGKRFCCSLSLPPSLFLPPLIEWMIAARIGFLINYYGLVSRNVNAARGR